MHKKNLEKITIEEFLYSIPDSYLIINRDYSIIAISKSYIHEFNLDAEPVLHKNFFEMFTQAVKDDNGNASNLLRNSFDLVIQTKNSDSLNFQKYHLRNPPQGTEKNIWNCYNYPVLDHDNEVLFIINRIEDVTSFMQFKYQDIAEKATEESVELELFKRAQELLEINTHLRQSDERLRLFIDSSKDYAFIILDPEGRITTWNSGAQRIKGYKTNEIVGKHFSIFYTKEANDKNHPSFELKVARENGRYEEESWRVRKDGTQFWANVIITPLYDDKGRLLGYGKVTRDLSDKKRAEQLKNEFVSIVSHELRTPLTSIKGSLGLILGGAVGEFNDKINNLLKIANSNCDRLSRLINDILDIEKIEAGKLTFNLRSYDLDKLLKEAIVVNQMYAEKYGVRLKLENISKVYITVDNDRLLQVLTNLISNAVKFSQKNDEVTINSQIIGKMVRVSIIDHGPGISEAFQEKIFQKFSQADSSATRSESGTGLGLAISKAIIERLGGRLEFSTVLGSGTSFYFDLPYQVTNINASSKFSEANKSKEPVLICEDDDDQGQYLSIMMTGAGYHSELCNTGSKAKFLLEENKYYALLLDLILPDMNGVDLIKYARQSKLNKNIPIIIVSVIPETNKKILNGGAIQIIDWLEKPVDFNKLSKAFTNIQQQIINDIPHLLHVEDDIGTQNIINNLFQERALIKTASSIQEAKILIENEKIDLVILDLLLPDGNGIELLSTLADNNIPVIVFSNASLEEKFSQRVRKILTKSETSLNKLNDSICDILNSIKR